MPWIRWDTSYSNNPKTRRLSWEAACCFNRVALWAKEVNDGGRVPLEDLDPDNLAALLSTKTAPPVEVCSRMVKEWIAVGYIVREGDVYVLPAFSKLQGDPGAAERMKRYRNERNARNVTAVTTTGQVRDVTGQDTPKKEKPRKGNPLLIPPGYNRKEWEALSPDQQYEAALKMATSHEPGIAVFMQHAADEGELWARRVCGKMGWRHFDEQGRPM